MEKKAVIGIGKLYYAVVESFDENELPVYKEVKGGNKLIDISIKNNNEDSSSSAGDETYLSTSEYAGTDFTISLFDLTDEERCDFYGHKMDKYGGIIYNSNDVTPYIAIMAEKTNMNETKKGKEYLTLFKGKMQEAEEKAKTKQKGKTEFQSYSISGKFENIENGDYFYYIDSLNDKFNATEWNKVWGKTVPSPTLALNQDSEGAS